MNRYCSVPRCTSRPSKEISMHNFPKFNSIKKHWIQLLGIKQPITNCMKVCSLHFSKENYVFPAISCKKRHLHKYSIPSMNLPCKKFNVAKHKRWLWKKANKVLIFMKKAKRNRQLINKNEDKGTSATRVPKKSKFGEKYNKSRFCEIIESNPGLYDFTGIPSLHALETICGIAKFREKNKTKLLLTLKQRVILVFTKLKTNMSFECLSVLFSLTVHKCIEYFYDTLEKLHEDLRYAIHWLDKSRIIQTMPVCFKKFINTQIVLDCFEMYVQKSKCRQCCARTYSHNKEDYTIKVMIGFAPSGVITFLSPIYGGRKCNRKIFLQSNILNKLKPYVDTIMVGEHFNIDYECMLCNIELIRSPLLEMVITGGDIYYSEKIAQAQVHIEKAKQRFEIFDILKHRIDINMVPYMDAIINVIAGLINVLFYLKE